MQLPGPVRAVVGLLATAADEARHLPDRAIELPMLAVSSALQMSLRAQQRYARLAARGDDIINRRPPGEEPPPWATFDDPVSADEVRAATQLLDQVLGAATAADVAAQDATAEGGEVEGASVTRLPAKRSPAKKAVAKRAGSAPATRASAEKAVVKAVPAAKKAVAKKTATDQKSPPAKKASAAQKSASAEKKAPVKGKTINHPRHASPSRFDTVGDD
jgi:hypothetical protein